MKFLFTGFDPFNFETINPSTLAVEALPDKIGEHEIVKAYLPTSYKRAPQMLLEAIEEHKPDFVICVGLAGRRKNVELEYCALNMADAIVPDNDGVIKNGVPVIPESDVTAYFSTLDLKEARLAVMKEQVFCQISYHAGTYVCNTLYFNLLHACQGRDMQGLFVHIPYLPEQAEKQPSCPSMPLEDDVKALTALVEFFGNK